VGRWLACQYDPKSSDALSAHEGVEFTASGRYYLLDSDGHGGLQRATTVKWNEGMAIEPAGSYSFWSTLARGDVSADDDVPTDQLYLDMDALPDGAVVDFEAQPRRFMMSNAIFVSADPEPDPGAMLLPGEGDICDPEGAACKGGLACPVVFPSTGSGVCTVPRTSERAERCDNLGVRTCAAGLTCIGACLRCGSHGGLGEACDGDISDNWHFYQDDFNVCRSQIRLCNPTEGDKRLHCNRESGQCAVPGPQGAWCADDSHCISGKCDRPATSCL
jgi:hypothetical protein